MCRILQIIGGVLFCLGLFGIMGALGAIDSGAAIRSEIIPVTIELSLIAAATAIFSISKAY